MKKIYTTSLVFSLFLNLTNAQSPNWQWLKTAGGPQYQQSQAVTADGAGNLYIAGYFEQSIVFGTDTVNKSGSGFDNGFIARYDTSGNFKWAQKVNGTVVGQSQIAIDKAGNIYLAGTYNSDSVVIGTVNLTGAGSNDFFLAKYDSSGNVLWAKTMGGTRSDILTGINIDISNNIYLTGSFSSTALTFGNQTLFNDTNPNMFIAKYNQSGDVIWAKEGNRSFIAQGQGISSDANGNVYVVGEFDGTIDLGGGPLIGNNALYIAKFDSAGSHAWSKSEIGGFADGLAISTDASGNSYVLIPFVLNTYILGTDTFTNASFISNDNLLIAKYGTNGTLEWADNATGDSLFVSASSSMVFDAQGYAYLTGLFKGKSFSFAGDTMMLGTGTNIFVMKLDGAGNGLWSKTAGGNDFNVGIGICLGPANNIYVTGSIGGFASFDADTITVPVNSNDAFLARLSNPMVIPTAVADIKNLPVGIIVYPNPSDNGNFCFTGANIGSTLQIFDIIGRPVYTSVINNNNYIVNLSAEAKGIYFYKITGKDNITHEGKIITE